jgi:hypothetical protein
MWYISYDTVWVIRKTVQIVSLYRKSTQVYCNTRIVTIRKSDTCIVSYRHYLRFWNRASGSQIRLFPSYMWSPFPFLVPWSPFPSPFCAHREELVDRPFLIPWSPSRVEKQQHSDDRRVRTGPFFFFWEFWLRLGRERDGWVSVY